MRSRVVSGLFLLAMLAGCGDALVPPPTPWRTPAAFTDPACRDIARTRAEDAAVNGQEAGGQARAARDAYQTCLALKAETGGAGAAP